MAFVYPPSPDSDEFSTPPTSPMPPTKSAYISVTEHESATAKRGGRPQKLLLDHSKTGSDHMQQSGQLDRTPRGFIPYSQSIPDIDEVAADHPTMSISEQALKSPCFVHSQLEKGASLADWLKRTHLNGPVNLAKSLGSPISSVASHQSSSPQPMDEEEEDEAFSRSLTRQLAETAVGVREMSKALGRARVHSDLQSVLIITKARDNRLVKLTREVALHLMQKKRSSSNGHNHRLIVYVDAQLRNSKRFDAEGMQRDFPELFVPIPRRKPSSSSLKSAQSHSDNHPESGEDGQLRYWTADMCSRSPHLFDFVVTLGGDGTVLFTSWLFQRIVPPVLSFALGSLGFLTNFDFADHKAVMDAAIDTGIRVNLRMRFTCTVYRAVAPEQCTRKRKAVRKGETGEILMKDLEKGGWEALEGGHNVNYPQGRKDKEIMCFTTRPVESFEVLNDLVVDRGPSPYVSLLELFGDEHHMTTVQADGLVVATPTGSTAYSLSAGGSLVHPEIPALLISPICPHTLSFRPMLLPDTMELRICVPYNSRSTAWASFDGRGRVELKQGDHIKVTASKYPFPTVCADKQSTDWFHAISRTLKWNERERQKSFVMVEEGPAKPKTVSAASGADPTESTLDEEDEAEDEEEVEEKFDIDDSSNPPTAPSSAVPSGASTPARHHSSPPQGLGMTAISPQSPKKPTPRTNDIERIDAGDRDNIHSPKSLIHGAKSKIPKDRDLDTMRTPRAHDSTPQPARVLVSPSRVPHAGRFGTLTDRSSRQPTRNHHRMHRSSRSADYGNRAFAVWGQDESDSNTDSEVGH
ncbi:hypothetical protein FS842_002128 [Serendipita sp. 407]|nr:hypothetical protein FS842_002128 [Serendipita sp. 407]